MDDIYVYYIKMPHGQHEWVTPCSTGYTVYLDESCLWDKDLRLREYRHALRHIQRCHWDWPDVNAIECDCRIPKDRHAR